LIMRGCLFFKFEKPLFNGVLLTPLYLALGFFQFYLLI
jgi:hypothetical protein